jgi:transposase
MRRAKFKLLDRTQPGLPMKKGRSGTMTHDYKRHGVTTLFAALNVLNGKVWGQCMKRNRHQEFIRFLNVIDARVPKKNTVHVIIDNYAAHKHPADASQYKSVNRPKWKSIGIGTPKHIDFSINISASSIARDRSRSITTSKINLHKPDVERQHRPIAGQQPAGLDSR